MPTQSLQYLFGKHQPDQEDLNTNYAIATNVVPRLRGYGPFPSFATASASQLPAGQTPLGSFTARTSTNSFKFFVGTQNTLWSYNSALTGFVPVGTGNASVAEPWSFDQFGKNVYATNINDGLQFIDVDTGSSFAAVVPDPGNPPLEPASDPVPKARYVKTVGDFLVLGAVAGDLRKIAWSGINNPRWWTFGVNSSDFQSFPDGGAVTAITGSDAGYVFQENVVRRMIFTPGGEPNFVFRFEKVENYHGAVAPRAVVPVGPHVFYLAQDGFYRIGPDGVLNIGFESVNSKFTSMVNQDPIGVDGRTLRDTIGVADPLHPRVYWAATTSDAVNQWLNRVLLFDYATQQWSEAEISLYELMTPAIAGIGLDDLSNILDYDNMDNNAIDHPDDPTALVSLDSRTWAGTAPILGGIDSNRRFGFFNGGPMEARISTAKIDIAPGRRSLIRKIRPLTDAPAPLISVSSLGFPSSDPAVVSGETAPEADGMCPQRAAGRYHRFNLRIPAGQTWTYALGVEVDAGPGGRR